MFRTIIAWGLMAVCVVFAAVPARAVDNPADKFIAEIISGARTNSARAEKLLAAGKILTAQPKICSAVLEKAVEFGMKAPVTPTGCKVVAGALDLLDAEFPDRRDDWTLKRADACRVRYRCTRIRSEKQAAGRELLTALLAAAEVHEKNGNWTRAAAGYRQAGPVNVWVKADKGGEIRRKLKAATHFATVAKRVVQHAASLKKDPSKASTRALLVKLLVVELDDPPRARPYLNEDVGEKWRTYVPLAAKGFDDLPEAACLELGQWYHKELSKSASPAGKGTLLRRAKDYYEQFVDLHSKVDIQTLRAKAALADVEKELAKLGAPAARAARPGSKTLILNLGKGVNMKFVRIPAGKFIMGAPKSEAGRRNDEGPQREVTISKAFYIGVTEVTQAQYESVTGKNPSNSKDPQKPVVSVSWDDATAFCTVLSKKTRQAIRLPTEAQWEYACRAGSKTVYSFGDDPTKLGDYAWCKSNSDGKTHPVGKKKPNPANLYDMHGNAFEWCRDWYDWSFYAKAKKVDPENTKEGNERVLRGGACYDPPEIGRSADRYSSPVARRDYRIGFRVVVEFIPRKK